MNYYKPVDFNINGTNEGHYDRLFSFEGKGINNEIIEVIFTLYNEKFYLFAVVSNDCKHCSDLLKTLNSDWKCLEKYDNIEMLILSSSPAKGVEYLSPGKFKFLLLEERDIFQFGPEVPIFYFVNGKGEVFFKQIGYSINLPAVISNLYERYYFRKSEVIMN